jgi:centromere protein C
MKYKSLPKSKVRTKPEGNTPGMAAQAFYVSYDYNPVYPGYIMGKLILPPKGMKDAECVGSCAQTFTILSGQPNSVEVAFADPNENVGKSNLRNAQRFLLDVGDVFRIPPGNSYQLQNHSKTHECTMSWTIIRPTHPEDMDET